MRERNWLEVYPYTRWGSAHELPVFDIGQRFMPSVLELRSVRLSPAVQRWSALHSRCVRD